jgi:hypothetical protein
VRADRADVDSCPVESIIAEDFTFSTPLDVGWIGRATSSDATTGRNTELGTAGFVRFKQIRRR